MDDASDRAVRSARELARRIGTEHHDVLVVLGSGLSGAAEVLGPSFRTTAPPVIVPTGGRWRSRDAASW